MQWRPVVHALTMPKLGPFMPKWIDSCPETMLMIDAGTKNGEMRRGPRAASSMQVSSIIGRPPMPEPTMTPMRSAFSSVTVSPLSVQAWMPAATP